MQYCMEHPEEISKLSKLKAQITEVKGIMMDNIEKVLFLLHVNLSKGLERWTCEIKWETSILDLACFWVAI